MKILVVEDNESLLVAMKMVFETISSKVDNPDLEVVFAEDLDSAITELQKQRFEVVSSDGIFPNRKGEPNNQLAGVTLLQRLDGLSHAGHVIFYSNAADQLLQASKIMVAGRPVLAYEKMSSKGLSGFDWAELCVRLAKDPSITVP